MSMISRETVIEIITEYAKQLKKEKYHAGAKVVKEIIRMITELAGFEWTLCSEKLPEYGVPVLTWDGAVYAVEKRIEAIRDEEGTPIISDWWVSDDYEEEVTDYYPNLRDGAAIAWMPLLEFDYQKEDLR